MKKPTPLPDLDLLALSFEYDPVTGVLSNRRTGSPLGTNDRSTEQMKVRIGRKTTQVQRVAWALFYREDPVDKRIIHINGDPRDNRIENLRAVKL